MQKKFTKFLASLLALIMIFSVFAVLPVSAEEETAYDLFICYGGDKDAEWDWGYEYWGTERYNSVGMTWQNASIKVGETATISMTFDSPAINTWCVSPCLIVEDTSVVTNVEFDITCKINGEDVAIDLAAGDAWWTEDTGDFKADRCIRLAGGYNEWGTKYIAEPGAITTIEYTITLKSIETAAVEAPEGDAAEYELFICYGGDKDAEWDWGYEYWGTERYNSVGMTWQNATIKVGETATISMTFESPAINTWCVSPCLIAEDTSVITNVEFDITCKINGEEVAIDLAAGDAWWTEDTGDYKADRCIRLAGGYNEWGTKYIAEPGAITTIEYTITLKSVETTEPEAPVVGNPEEFELFIAYGGDKESENDWGYEYWGAERYNSVGITWSNATIKVGETATISLTFDTPAINSWVFAPCLVANDITGITSLDYTITCKINGEDVAIDMAAGDAWWAEATGDYSAEQCIRLAGSYNEWGTKYVAEPGAVTTIEYTITLNEVTFKEEAPVVTEGPEFDLFIAYGGDRAESNDWGYEYYGADTDKSAGITAVTDKISVGETVTVSLTFENAAVYSWFFSPCLVADDISWIGDLDFDIVCKVNGQEVDINMAADSQGRTWWTEGTGEYSGTQCIRLAGGYNEWGAQFIAQPQGLTTIEYTITLNAVEEAADPGAEVESTEEYYLFLGYGGDKAAEGDWGWGYGGEETAPEGITAVTATVKSGDTATISLTFDTATVNSWWFAPTLVGTGAGTLISDIDFNIVCKIDGVEVPVNMEADAEGKTFWSEGTGSFKGEDCVRLGGGYNEWATKYIDEPGSFTTIEYTITFNSIKVSTPVEEEPTIVEIDKMGTYNAYLMLQTPNWTFRNAHDDAFYGFEGSSWEALGLAWGQYLVHQDHPGETWGVVTDAVIAGNGTYSVKITDFGTIFADDFAAAGQEYFNIIAISTDLPAGANVTITNVELIIDGKVRHTYENAYINEESTGSLQILVQNIWNSDVKELNYYPAPTESLEIRFTISGFDYDQVSENPGEEEQPTNPAETKPAETTPNASQPVATDPAGTEPAGNNTGIIIAVVVVVIIGAVVAVLVIKKKKN